MRPMDAIGVELREAMNEPGCPVCRLLQRFEERTIEAFLYERPTDPELRRAFRRSGGLCRRHAWRVLKLALSSPLLGPHGVSTIYADVLECYLRGNCSRGNCFLCELEGEKERILIESLADRLSDLIGDYERSPSILCRRHYEEVLRLVDEGTGKRLSEVQRGKVKELSERLERFIETFDYRIEREPTEEERRALVEAVEFLVGKAGPERSDGRRRLWRLR